MRYHLSSGIFYSKNQCACLLQVLHACMHKFSGRLLYKLDALRLTFFSRLLCVVVSLQGVDEIRLVVY